MVNIISVIKTLINKVIALDNNTVDKTTMVKFYSKKAITPTVTWANGWSKVELNVYLNGNILSTWVKAKKSSNTGAGDFSDQLMCTITLPASIGINNFYNTSSITSGTGGLASFKTADASLSNGAMKFNVYISSTHAAENQFSFWLNNVVVYNPDTVFDTLA